MAARRGSASAVIAAGKGRARSAPSKATALGIARHYRGLIDGLVIDEADRALADPIAALGMAVHVTDTIMRNGPTRRRLGEETLTFADQLALSRR